MEERHFKADAKSVVDACFDAKLFKDDLSRDDMVAMEDLISFMLKSRFEGYISATKLSERIQRKREIKPTPNEGMQE